MEFGRPFQDSQWRAYGGFGIAGVGHIARDLPHNFGFGEQFPRDVFGKCFAVVLEKYLLNFQAVGLFECGEVFRRGKFRKFPQCAFCVGVFGEFLLGEFIEFVYGFHCAVFSGLWFRCI